MSYPLTPAQERDLMRKYLTDHPEAERMIAYHEAGHAVQYLLMCRKYATWPHISSITIVPDMVNNGRVTIRPFIHKTDVLTWPHIPTEHRHHCYERAQEQIKFELAGYAMEFENGTEYEDAWEYFEDTAFISPEGDMANAAWWAEQLTGGSFETEGAAYQLCFDLFQEVLNDLKPEKPKIEAITNLLVEYKTVDEAMIETFYEVPA